MHAPSSRTVAARERHVIARGARPPVRRDTHHMWQQQRLQQRHHVARRCCNGEQHARA